MNKLAGTQAGKRLSEIIALASDPSPAKIAAHLSDALTPANFEKLPLEKRIGTFMGWRARGGFEIVEIVEAALTYAEAIVRQPVTDEHWRLAVELEATAPHRIESLLLGRSPMPPSPNTSDDRDVANGFLSYVARLAEADLFSGAVLMGRHGEILCQGAFGMANRDFDVPNRIDTRFDVASLCKSWTAVAICQLIEAGHFSLDTPVSTFLAYPSPSAAREIRIKHLLSHTSGLDSYFTKEFDRTARQHMRSIDDFLQLTKHQMPAFPPGSASKYSNTGMVLLGKIIEIVTGKSYFQQIHDSIFVPARMTSAGFPELDFVNKNIAVGYNTIWTLEGSRVANTLFEGQIRGLPAGCGYATVGDIFHFVEAFKLGELVSPEMVEAMTSPKPELGAPHYGYGFSIHPERALYGHSGGLVGASANVDVTLNPDGWVIVVLANDLGMRPPVLKGRQIAGVTVPESEEARSYLPRAGMAER